MRSLLLDADAFNALQKLGFMDEFCASRNRGERMLMTEFIARTELSSHQDRIRALEQAGCLRVHPVEVRSAAGRRWRTLRHEGVHKGEAEAIAWALEYDVAARPVFVSREGAARAHAEQRGVPTVDVFGCIVGATEGGWIERAAARRALLPWDDKRQQLGRPRDYTSFDEAYARRRREACAAFDLPV